MNAPSSPSAVDRRSLLLGGAAVSAGLATGALGLTATDGFAAAVSSSPGTRVTFGANWRFLRGAGSSPGEASLAAVGVDDAGWREVRLPHDWNIENLKPDPEDASRIIGPFDAKAPGGIMSGFAAGGEGWYRKTLRLESRPGRVELRFEGAYHDTEVWLNGRPMGGHGHGYTPFRIDLTPGLSPDGDNFLAVRVRSLGANARWYSGAGLYRPVHLDIWPTSARIAPWGVKIATRRLDARTAQLEIDCAIDEPTSDLLVVHRIMDDQGRTVWQGRAPAAAALHHTPELAAPRAWSPDTPHLYTLVTELRRGRETIDRVETPFGVRIVTFDPVEGMKINGVDTKLRGGCIHHDHGILGAAAFEAAEIRKVALLKARGFNAVRPSHNLFSPAFLRACDRQGLFVISELFDVWNVEKFSPEDGSASFDATWRETLEATILSSRNHPSVIMWSIGNEIPGRNRPEGVEVQWRLADAVHRLDPTRPVTAGVNGFAGHEVAPDPASLSPGQSPLPDRTSTLFLDIIGYNYKLADYAGDHARYPARIVFGSESFPHDVFGIWDLTERTPWLIGDFVWTAIDYLGEAGIGGSTLTLPGEPAGTASPAAWPWINAYCGDLDLIGRQKPGSLARDVAWGVSSLEIGVRRPVPEGRTETPRMWGWTDELQSWSWPGEEGRPMAISVYARADALELRLNGALVERRELADAAPGRSVFTAPYAPGALEVRAFRDGAEVGRRTLDTTGAPARVRLTAEPYVGGAGAEDLVFVTVEVTDAAGRWTPDAEVDLDIALGGVATLAAFGSANPLANSGYQSLRTRSWRGRALIVLRGQGRSGRTSVRIAGPDLIPEMLELRLA